MKDSDKKIYFQTVTVTARHPGTKEEFTRTFAGKAILTPQEIEQFKDQPAESFIIGIEFDKPYNPYDDPDNDAANNVAIRALRSMLREMEEEKDGERND